MAYPRLRLPGHLLLYLGSLLSSNCILDSELSRRIGAASADFRQLCAAWNHSSLSRKQKLDFFNALIVSKLTYGMSVTWLLAAQRRRLDGFYARCLRKILRIPAAFYSRVSNNAVFSRANVEPLTARIMRRQLIFLGRVALLPADDPRRKCVFVGDTLNLQVDRYVRKRGRPRLTWSKEVFNMAIALFGVARSHLLLRDRSPGALQRWTVKVRSFTTAALVVGRETFR